MLLEAQEAELGSVNCQLVNLTNRLAAAAAKSLQSFRKFTVHVLLKPGLENLSITLLACEMSAVVR